MGISKSRIKKVAPVSVTEETVSSRSGIHRDESHLFGPSMSKDSDLRVSVIRRSQADCNSEFSVVDLAEEVDRILAEYDNTDISLNRTYYKMPIIESNTLGLYYYAKGQDGYSGSTRDRNEINTPTSLHEKVGPPQDLLNCANIKSTATALGSAIGSGSSVALPRYDASEEDLMNTIEREFGSQPHEEKENI